MSLSKQQMIGAAGGGVFALGVLALGFLCFSAWSAKSEAEEELDAESSAFEKFNSAPVYPSKGAIDAVKSNETSFAEWRAAACTLAAQGDRLFATETPAIFKQRLQAEVRRMLALPGGLDGKIAASTFLFGFEQYLGESGVLPKEADVPRLAVQLDTITQVVNLFAEAGVLEIKGVQRIEPTSAQPAKDGEGDEKKVAPKKRVKSGKAREEEDEATTTKQSYGFTVVARPAGLVAILNRLASCPRFATVRGLAFAQAADVITDRLNAAQSAKEMKSAPKRRSRRGAAATVVEEKTDANQVSEVYNPEVDSAIQISFTLDVVDFGRGKVQTPVAPKVVADEKPAAKTAAQPAAKPAQDAAAKPAAQEEKKEVGNEFLQ